MHWRCTCSRPPGTRWDVQADSGAEYKYNDWLSYLLVWTETSCENGIVYNSTCYKIHREQRVNWFTAVNRCLSNKGSLAVFDDNILTYFASSLLREGPLWIGLIKSRWTWPDAGLSYTDIDLTLLDNGIFVIWNYSRFCHLLFYEIVFCRFSAVSCVLQNTNRNIGGPAQLINPVQWLKVNKIQIKMSTHVQTKQMYCTTNSTLHRLLLKIFHVIHIQTRAVSLIATILGECHGAQMNIVLSANQVP